MLKPSRKKFQTPAQPRLPEMRHAVILDALQLNGAVHVREVAQKLQVSNMTVRRDLVELERAGKLMRTHGGAIRVEGMEGVVVDQDEPDFDLRLRHNRGPKERIAGAAAALALNYRSVALDVGTTTFLVAHHLRDRAQARVFTNSVRIAAHMGMGQAEVYLVGGRVRPYELSVGGAEAIAQLEKLWFDICFVGISGLTSDGLFDYSIEDVDLKKVYLQRSGLKVALCDSSKFKRMSLVHVAALTDIDVVITDAEPPADIAMALSAAKVDLQIAR